MAAETRIPSIEIVASGSEITLNVSGVTLRDALSRVVGEGTITIEWLSESVADEPIKGEYRGTVAKVVTALLDRSSFIITYDRDGEELRIARITVIGPTSPKALDAQPVRTQLGKKKHATTASERRRLREQMMEKMRANAEAARKRRMLVPPGGQPVPGENSG